MSQPPASKRCPRCEQVKPASAYGKSKVEACGLRSYCRTCEAKAMKDKRADRKKARSVPPGRTDPPRSLAGGPHLAEFDGSVEIGDREFEDPEDAAANAQAAAEAARANDEQRAREAAERRRASDFQPLRPDDFDVGLGGDPQMGNDAGRGNRGMRARASAEKRQEFNAAMGEFGGALRDAALAAPGRDGEIVLPPEYAAYIDKLAEQERRHGNRRWARSVAIAEAHEHLSRRAAMWVADRYFRDRVEPTGYARIKPDHGGKRTVCLLLSDLHLGSELDTLDEPVAFRAVEEARRLEYILRQVIDYKPQHRADSEFLLLIIGDVIEGQLLHDLRAGSPLVEQKAIFWSYFREFVSQVAAHYPRGRVFMTPGNHGRDKLRHPGRATTKKWDGHEWEIYYALRQMCSGLHNVEWSLPFRAVEPIPLHGSHLLATHADTEVKIGHPDTKAKENARILDRINSTRMYGVEFGGATFGHYHTPRYIPGNPRVLFNGALVPPNGYARSEGHIGDVCGQFMFEAVEGFPIGDVRYIEVGPSQDRDERLGKIIKPFRFSSED